MQKNKYQAYAAATQTVARTRQIVMLYDGAIRLVQQAEVAIRDKRIEDRYHLLRRATEIINGLQACLDFERGGEIAQVLHNFYTTVGNQIFSIHRTNSLDTCGEVIASLKNMRDVWQEIDDSTSTEAASGEDTISRNVVDHKQAAPAAVPVDMLPIDIDQGLTLSA